MTEQLDLGRAPRGAVGRLVRREMRHEWRVIAVAALATLAGSAAVAAGPTLIRVALDDGVQAADRRVLGWAVLAYVVTLATAGLTAGVRAVAMARASERFIDRLRVASLAGILRMDLRTFERTRRGDLLARVSADTEALSAASRWVLPEAVRNATDLTAALIALALLDPLFALAALVAVPPMYWAGRRLRTKSATVYPRHRAEVGALVGQLTETVEATETVRSYRREQQRLDLLRAANGRVTDRYMDGTAMRVRFYAAITVTRVAATAVVLVVASLLAIDGRTTIGTSAAAVLAVSTVFGPLAWLTELLDDVLSARAALGRVVATTEAVEAGGTAELPAAGDLHLEGVTFGYDPAQPVLNGVDLTIAAGTRTAIVGETGVGKSTLARLAAGLTAPDEGRVTFGGVDLRDASADARRSRILYVLQEPAVLTGTIADNVRLVDPDLTDSGVEALADELGVGEWLRAHPDGARRATGNAGDALSFGERQLVGVLRIAAADPAIVILDEATAVLDPRTEQVVGESLDRALGDRTVVVIAHRVATARRAERLIRVAGGRAIDEVHTPVART